MKNCSAANQCNPNIYYLKFVYFLFYNIMQIKAPIACMGDQSYTGAIFVCLCPGLDLEVFQLKG